MYTINLYVNKIIFPLIYTYIDNNYIIIFNFTVHRIINFCLKYSFLPRKYENYRQVYNLSYLYVYVNI